MSIKQLSNKRDPFIIREEKHNAMSIFFFLILSFSILLMIMISVILLKNLLLTIFLAISFALSIIKLLFQVSAYSKLNNLVKKVDANNINFYITKSWTRKRESSIWISASLLFIDLIFIIISLSLINVMSDVKYYFVVFIVLGISPLFIIIAAYLNIQIMDSYLKISKKRINLSSVEWIQIRRDQKIFYRLVFIWIVSFLTIIPLLLMVIPAYRSLIYELVKK